jgi:rhodanese-related sulfurtransferase
MAMQTLAGKNLGWYLRHHPHAMLIDLRPGKAYRHSHVKGAVNVPYETLDQIDRDFFADRELIFYCELGGSAMSAAREWAEKGWKTAAVIGTYEEIQRLTEIVTSYNIR